jgi:hypothetical protein
MPAVLIASDEQYEKAIEVLTRVGGTWQGVGRKERFLLVSEAQHRALIEAKVASSERNAKKESGRGKNIRNAAEP